MSPRAGSDFSLEERAAGLEVLLSRNPPEEVRAHSYGEAVDCWALGCITAEMYCGDCFFGRGADAAIFERIVAQLGPIPNDGALSQLPRYGRKPKAPPLKPPSRKSPAQPVGPKTGGRNGSQHILKSCLESEWLAAQPNKKNDHCPSPLTLPS